MDGRETIRWERKISEGKEIVEGGAREVQFLLVKT